MAFERVYIEDNTSVIQDEVLAHRIGLIPLNYDLTDDWFEFISSEEASLGNFTQKNTATFELDVTCSLNPDPSSKTKYLNEKVYSGDIKWKAIADQESKFQEKPLKPMMDDILIAKLRPGQRIKMEIFAHLGIGADHAKFSPVATAFYRLRPDPTIVSPISGEDAQKLKNTCPLKVFDIEESHAIVKYPTKCTVCRECIRHPEFAEKIQLRRSKEHFLFSIESVGAMDPAVLFNRAIQVLLDKADRLQKAIEKL